MRCVELLWRCCPQGDVDVRAVRERFGMLFAEDLGKCCSGLSVFDHKMIVDFEHVGPGHRKFVNRGWVIGLKDRVAPGAIRFVPAAYKLYAGGRRGLACEKALGRFLCASRAKRIRREDLHENSPPLNCLRGENGERTKGPSVARGRYTFTEVPPQLSGSTSAIVSV